MLLKKKKNWHTQSAIQHVKIMSRFVLSQQAKLTDIFYQNTNNMNDLPFRRSFVGGMLGMLQTYISMYFESQKLKHIDGFNCSNEINKY